MTRKFTFKLVDQEGRTSCSNEIETDTEPIFCPKPKQVFAGECSLSENRRRIVTEHYSVDPESCACIPKKEVHFEACGKCQHASLSKNYKTDDPDELIPCRLSHEEHAEGYLQRE